MSYINQIAVAIGHRCSARMSDPAQMDLMRIYAVLCCTKGEATTNQDVHDAWSAWTDGRNPEHKSLVPFGELTAEVQDMDTPYREAIQGVAASIASRS